MGCNSHFTSHLHVISKDALGSGSKTTRWESITSDFILENTLAGISYDSGLYFLTYFTIKKTDVTVISFHIFFKLLSGS